MSVFTIEAGIALLGLVLLLVEAFKPDISRRTLGLTAITGIWRQTFRVNPEPR
jgi:hypothetical protein